MQFFTVCGLDGTFHFCGFLARQQTKSARQERGVHRPLDKTDRQDDQNVHLGVLSGLFSHSTAGKELEPNSTRLQFQCYECESTEAGGCSDSVRKTETQSQLYVGNRFNK